MRIEFSKKGNFREQKSSIKLDSKEPVFRCRGNEPILFFLYFEAVPNVRELIIFFTYRCGINPI